MNTPAPATGPAAVVPPVAVPPVVPSGAPRSASALDPDQVWKTLALVNDWIKHAETKLAAALTGAGLVGGVLFNLAQGPGQRTNRVLNVLSVACAITVVVAGGAAIVGLRPRVRIRSQQVDRPNPLYFDDIAATFEQDALGYHTALRGVLTDPETLVHYLGQQVYAVSLVARAKYRWAARATGALFASLLLLTAVATVTAVAR